MCPTPAIKRRARHAGKPAAKEPAAKKKSKRARAPARGAARKKSR
jgi:hypothetical protein